VVTLGCQLLSFSGYKCRALENSAFAKLARFILSWSALLITIASAISIIPRLIPCNSSPAPANFSNKKKSTIECTAISLCPTPTVSIKIVLKPAASHKMMVSRVFCATPPKDSPLGEGRIYAFGSFTNSSIRVLSPKILPLLIELLGSMAKTATLFPFWVKYFPKASIKVLFPTPGTPVIPILTDLFAKGKHCSIMAFAFA
jgi:hypothetical protein